MKEYPSFQDYLQRFPSDGKRSEAELAAMKKQYQKDRRKFYYQREKNQYERISITFTKREFQQVEKKALETKKKLAIYAREILLEKVDYMPLLPSNDLLAALQKDLHKTANNINQLVRKSHQYKSYAVTKGTDNYISQSEEMAIQKALRGLTTGNTIYKELVQKIRAMETTIQQLETTTPDLYVELEKALLDSPEQLEKVKELIARIESETK